MTIRRERGSYGRPRSGEERSFMRRLGTIADKLAAEQFELFLRLERQECRREEVAGGSEFWLYDEDRLGEMRSALERYQRGEFIPLPPLPKAPSRSQLQEVPVERHSAAGAGRRSRLRGIFARAPGTVTICLACVVVTLLTGFFQVDTAFTRALAIIPLRAQQSGGSWQIVDDNPLFWFRQGEVWRVFTPALMHAHPLHLLLNLNLFYVFGTAIEHLRGTSRFLGLTVLSAVISNLAQYWWGGPLFCGLSGVGYALYGYVWMKSLFQPETRFIIPRSLHLMFWIWTAFCLSGILPIANGAHLGGLLVGILYGMIPFL